MPQVPRLSSPQIRESAGPNLQANVPANPEAFNAGESRQQLMNTVGKVYEQAKNNADQLAVLEADKKLSALETQLLYDPKSGAFNKRGKDAFGSVEQVDTDFSKGIDEIENSLSNETQKSSFRKMYYQRQQDVNRQLSKHVAGQIQAYDNAETEAYIETERNAVTSNPYDQDRIGLSMERQRGAIYQHAERNGLPEEWTKNKILEAQSKTASSALSKMLADGNDMKASEFYKNNKDLFVGKDATEAEKDVQDGSLRGNSQRRSDEIFSKNIPMSQALDEAKKIEDPKLRDATVERLKANYQMKDMADRDAREKNHIVAANILDKSNGDLDALERNPVWKSFSVTERSQLESYAKHKREGTEPKTNWGEYYQLKTLASSPLTRDKFAQTNLMEYRNLLGDTEFKELAGLQTSVREKDGKADKVLDGFMTDQMIVNDALTKIGIKDKNSDEAVAFRQYVDRQVISAKGSSESKTINNNEFRKIVDEGSKQYVLDKGILGTGFFPKTKRGYQLDSEDDPILEVADIPKDRKDEIATKLQKKGIPATDSRIIEIYKSLLESRSSRGL